MDYTSLNKIIKESYQQQKKKYKKENTIPEHLKNAWDFIDHLFVLEAKSRGSDYLSILAFLIPLEKPQTSKENKQVFIDYLALIGISSTHDAFDQLLAYYDAELNKKPTFSLNFS